jgi:hypothetical protein
MSQFLQRASDLQQPAQPPSTETLVAGPDTYRSPRHQMPSYQCIEGWGALDNVMS